MKRIIPILLCLVLLLCGCGGRSGGASAGDLQPKESSAVSSEGDLWESSGSRASMESLLLDGNGYWRSEQQGPEDEGVTVRELVLSPDGTLTYREGDWGSEYCYFAAGRWTVDERILSVTFFETGEDFAGPTPGAAEQAATFSVGFDREMLLLTQETETGFCLGRQGQTVYYFHPIE